MTARTTTKTIAGLLLGLTLLGGVGEPAHAMLDAGRVRVSSSSGVNLADPGDDDTAITTRKWDYIRM
jgi:hypothetical protein